MRMMALAMLIFLIAIGTATFIESMYGIQAAKILVYNATWFEILLAFLCINLIANIFRYQMYKREKIALFTFHLSFIIIIIGAAITRFFSYEGLMLIREGTASDFIYLSEPHLWFRINDGKMQYVYNDKLYLSEVTNNNFDINVGDFPNHKSTIRIEFIGFKARQIDTLLIKDSIKGHVLDIVTNGKQSNYLGKNKFMMLGDIPLSYEKKNSAPGIDIVEQNGELMFSTKLPMQYLPMSEMRKVRESGAAISDSLYVKIPVDTLVPLLPTTLYLIQGQQFVFNRKIDHAKMTKMSSGKKDVGTDILTLRVTDGTESRIVELEGGMGQMPEAEVFVLNGLQYEMKYGSTEKKLPFSIACRDFILDKYPGSDVASSFASEVTVIDDKKKYRHDQRIFMNHVMDYGGYRFFQSSYDLDNPQTPENEEGTRLSVNYDFWGTNVTYVGYLLMAIGMVLSLFAPAGRFKELLTKIRKSRERRESTLAALLVLFGMFHLNAFAQENHDHDHNHDHAVEEQQHTENDPLKTGKSFKVMSVEHSEEFASLLVQDFKGRIVPAHTLCDELLRKIYGKNKYGKYNAVQAIMSMHMFQPYWEKQKIISVPKAVRERLKLGEYASRTELVDPQGNFKWLNDYNTAHRKLESKRSEFDKKLIKLVERLEVVNAILMWQYMKILPVKNDPNNTWYLPFDGQLMAGQDPSIPVAMSYLEALFDACKTGQYGLATDKLSALKNYQRKTAEKIVPRKELVKLEISYNKMTIFKNAMYAYFCLGFILLIIFFVRIFVKPSLRNEKRFKRLAMPFIVLMGVIFLYHAAGLIMRWYISGHAPWSNGYEAIVFIAWGTVLVGLILSPKNPIVPAGTAILAYFMLFVSELNLLDPEITPLQPVLKSYWLQIHVSIITSSYGPLGIGAILGLLNMILYIFRNKNNGQRITAHINEITYISEISITIGLFMLAIGTFLGGVWANESWGRYWGWDPKETWALVSVLVYAVILHLRYIPALSGKFTFNLVSLWCYSAILFTFFGVNFYLVGLHSYAQGEGLPEVPVWLYYTVGAFVLFSILSYVRYRSYARKLK